MLLCGGVHQAIMLEKSRVVRRSEGEPTFHVLYQMLAGIDATLRYAVAFHRYLLNVKATLIIYFLLFSMNLSCKLN